MLRTMLLRSMRQAIYDPTVAAGLALQSYALLRRFVVIDLALHRAIDICWRRASGNT